MSNNRQQFGSHIDEEGNISFVRPTQQDRQQAREDNTYGIWGQNVQESVFNGTRQLGRTSLAMNFRKSEVVQHNPDTGIRITQALAKSDGAPTTQTISTSKKAQKESIEIDDGDRPLREKPSKKHASVSFDEKNLRETKQRNQHQLPNHFRTFGEDDVDDIVNNGEFEEEDEEDSYARPSFTGGLGSSKQKAAEPTETGQDFFRSFFTKQPPPQQAPVAASPSKVKDEQLKDIEDLSSGNEENQEVEEDKEDSNSNDEGKDKQEEEDEDENSEEDSNEDEDEDGEGFGGRRKRKKLFFKSSNAKKSNLKQKKSTSESLKQKGKKGTQQESEDEDEGMYSKQKSQQKQQPKNEKQKGILSLTKEQERKKRIYNFKRSVEQDDEAMLLEEQQRLLNLPMNFGMQRKQMRRNEEQMDSNEIGDVDDMAALDSGLNKGKSGETAQKMAEDFGKGFKMLQKMGYKAGQGMGKYEQGRSKAIEAVHKQSFTMHDNIKQIENEYRRMLREEFQIDVESELDQLEKDLMNFRQLDASQYDIQDDDEENDEENNRKKDKKKNKKQYKRYGDDDEEEEDEEEDNEDAVKLEKTYVSRKEQQEKQKRSQFPNRFFAYLDKKGRDAKRRKDHIPNLGEKPSLASAGKSIIGGGLVGKIVDMRGASAMSFAGSGESNGYADFFSFNRGKTPMSTTQELANLAKQSNAIPQVLTDIVYSLKNKLAKFASKQASLSSKLRIESDRIVAVEYEEKQVRSLAAEQQESSNATVNLLRQLREMLNSPKPLTSYETFDTFEAIFVSAAKPFASFQIDQLFVKSIAESLSRDLSNRQLERRATRIARQEFEDEEQDQVEGKAAAENVIEEGYRKTKQSYSVESDISRDDAKFATVLIERAETMITKVLLSRQNAGIESYEHELQKGIRLSRDVELDETNSRTRSRYVQYIANNSFMAQLKSYMMKSFVPTDLLSNNELIDCVEIYSRVLPSASVQDLLSTLVVPKLNAAVKKWEVATKKKSKSKKQKSKDDGEDTNAAQKVQGEGEDNGEDSSSNVNVDLWLLPWMAVVSPVDQLKETFKLVMAKYAQALQKWEVEDTSMLEKLLPWKKVISQSQWNDLLFKQVIPKLSYYLETFEINPSEQQGLEVVQSVVQWCEHISETDICNIMEESLLVKIAEVLMEWISACEENAAAEAERKAKERGDEGEDDEDDDEELGGDNTADSGFREIEEWLRGWEAILGEKIMAIHSFSVSFAQFFEKIEAAS